MADATRSNQSAASVATASCLPITICNVNPIKGFELFLQPNGSQLYDTISDIWQTTSGHYNSARILSKEMLQRSSHNITDMLLRCLISSSKCSSDDFYSVWMEHKVCYQIVISPTDTVLSLALDPEEQHYLVPGLGFTGFSVYVDNIKTKDNRSPHTEIFYVSGALHSIIKISMSFESKDKKCDLSLYQRCVDHCKNRHPSVCRCGHTIKDCHPSYQLFTHYQTTQSSFFNRLILIKSQRNNTNACLGLLASLIQKRSLIRHVSGPFFQEVVHLADLIRQMHAARHQTTQLVSSIQTQIFSDLYRLQLIEDDSGLCDLPYLLTQLNSSMDGLYIIPDNISTGTNHCLSESWMRTHYELLIVEMIFSSQYSTARSPSLSSNINGLTMLNMKYRDRFSSTTSCHNEVVRKIGALYSRLISDFVSKFIDYSHLNTRLYFHVTAVARKYANIISPIKTQDISNKHSNLVTISIEISSESQSNVAEPQVNTDSVHPAYVITDLLDIICSNVALAALLIILVKYASNRCTTRRQSRRSIVRRNVTTETTDMIEFLNNTSLEQITFTM